MSRRSQSFRRCIGRIHGGRIRALTLCLALGSAEPSRAGPPGFSLRAGALFCVRVYRDPSTLFSHYSHDHVIQAQLGSSSIQFDAANPGACRASLHFPVNALLPDEPALRRRLGMPIVLDESDRNSVREHLLAADQLDARRYPEVEVLVQSCVVSATPGQYLADIAVTVHGRTQRRAGAVLLRVEGGRLRTRGTLRLRHSDFGITAFSAWLGSVRNLDVLDLVWSLEAEPIPAAPAP